MPEVDIVSALSRIRQKLAKLREADRNLVVRGADRHNYQLNPTLDERLMIAFEMQAKVSIPEEYRAFLIELGNGGAGPDAGLCSFDVNRNDPLDLPFPISNAAVESALLHSGKAGIDESWKDLVPSRAGWLCISHSRCVDGTILIVTGEQRGRVWEIDPYDRFHVQVNGHGEQIGFLVWYEDWLDQRLQPNVMGKWDLFDL